MIDTILTAEQLPVGTVYTHDGVETFTKTQAQVLDGVYFRRIVCKDQSGFRRTTNATCRFALNREDFHTHRTEWELGGWILQMPAVPQKPTGEPPPSIPWYDEVRMREVVGAEPKTEGFGLPELREWDE